MRYNKTTEIPIWCTRISIPLPESPNRQALSRYARHEVQPVYKVSELHVPPGNCLPGGGGGGGEACLYCFQTYLQETVGQGYGLFIQFQGFYPLVVQPVYKVSKPTYKVLSARGATYLYSF